MQDKVRADPGDPKLRIFLFQLLCVLGDWKRAITQLKLCAELDPAAIPMAQTYREAIICEVFRGKVFSGEKDAMIFGEPSEWIALMGQALKAEAGGEAAKAARLRERAFEEAPASTGEINGARFDWIADADMRLGPILEIIVNGKYFWMPFSAIATLTAEDPADLRDAVWTACHLTLHNGGDFVALIPTRYPGTEKIDDDNAALSRSTNWSEIGDGCQIGFGQRLLATDAGDTAIMDLRLLRIDPAGGDG